MEKNRYKLTRTSIAGGKFLYQVIDAKDGHVVRERKSRRTYVAAAVFDNYFYGRNDLVFTGDRWKRHLELKAEFESPRTTPERKAELKELIERCDAIAYLDE